MKMYFVNKIKDKSFMNTLDLASKGEKNLVS